jgi:hypothetical protein
MYYKYLVRYHVHEKDMHQAALAYQIIYDALMKATTNEALIAEMDGSGSDRKSSF